MPVDLEGAIVYQGKSCEQKLTPLGNNNISNICL